MLDEAMMPSLVNGMLSISLSGNGMLVARASTSSAFSSVTEIPMLGIFAAKETHIYYTNSHSAKCQFVERHFTNNSGLWQTWIIVHDAHISRNLQGNWFDNMQSRDPAKCERFLPIVGGLGKQNLNILDIQFEAIVRLVHDLLENGL